MTTDAPRATDDAAAAAPDETYDVIVIGAGAVGENVADRAGRSGLSVAVVEAELAGGECSYWACMPSKALLRPGAVVEAARAVAGVAASPVIDAAKVLAHRDDVASHWDDSGQADWIESAGMTLVRGRATIVAPRTVRVDPSVLPAGDDGGSAAHDGGPRTLRARHAVVVSTGSVPRLPDVPGLAAAEPWGSREATSAEQVPDSLVVVGGGVVATEMATAYADLGSRVTVLARGALLGTMEPFVGEAVTAALRASGVDVVVGASPTRVERHEGGEVTVAYDGPQGPESVTAAEILVATGRVPRTGDVGLENVGSPLDAARGLDVDPTGLVRGVEGDWLYATGDVLGTVATTHQGKYQARVCGDAIAARFARDDPREGVATWGGDVPEAREEPAPWTRYAASADVSAQTQVVFTRPQASSVGPTLAQARDAGLDVRAVEYELGDVAGGYLMGEGFSGTASILVDEARRVIVGATFVGAEAGEMLHAATVAVVGEVPLERLWHAVPAYPTVSEVWLRLLETYGL
ncbi:NAD(P)/FAD-dependent oxidoreductase [Cellulomonas sp. PhB143]|uniref:dihydrolipoyl dehydrogenase family protein n=1 Tax=Cellulomonas sp. PhB143 TaxID=2485186 RepID=UPI000F45F115|nr:NAD(P)/FAD-dependent oxidoreductase [Cellulomonas sp. PhB143]ROS77025.1 dihydrolipoamide dehydrogenase [Cellulomonas sp. PhB143]